MSKTMIGSCSSAGRNLKTKRSSAAGKTLATTCKTKKAAAKATASKPVVKKTVSKPVVKKDAPKRVVKKTAPKLAVKKSVVMVKPKAVKTYSKPKSSDKFKPGDRVTSYFRYDYTYNNYEPLFLEQGGRDNDYEGIVKGIKDGFYEIKYQGIDYIVTFPVQVVDNFVEKSR